MPTETISCASDGKIRKDLNQIAPQSKQKEPVRPTEYDATQNVSKHETSKVSLAQRENKTNVKPTTEIQCVQDAPMNLSLGIRKSIESPVKTSPAPPVLQVDRKESQPNTNRSVSQTENEISLAVASILGSSVKTPPSLNTTPKAKKHSHSASAVSDSSCTSSSSSDSESNSSSSSESSTTMEEDENIREMHLNSKRYRKTHRAREQPPAGRDWPSKSPGKDKNIIRINGCKRGQPEKQVKSALEDCKPKHSPNKAHVNVKVISNKNNRVQKNVKPVEPVERQSKDQPDSNVTDIRPQTVAHPPPRLPSRLKLNSRLDSDNSFIQPTPQKPNPRSAANLSVRTYRSVKLRSPSKRTASKALTATLKSEKVHATKKASNKVATATAPAKANVNDKQQENAPINNVTDTTPLPSNAPKEMKSPVTVRQDAIYAVLEQLHGK
ncbi:hypothetical protein ZHAS_00017948 [Anopheles sinensis]|uniref:Uncharacterized protein n=1 Tax=Anopheles sinensis TaxID=74873 RepID=A0A084WHI4_ANOSI|nr:hypothetical protein ZHAS_00017948 [Anopheles sinensis]